MSMAVIISYQLFWSMIQLKFRNQRAVSPEAQQDEFVHFFIFITYAEVKGAIMSSHVTTELTAPASNPPPPPLIVGAQWLNGTGTSLSPATVNLISFVFYHGTIAKLYQMYYVHDISVAILKYFFAESFYH